MPIRHNRLFVKFNAIEWFRMSLEFHRSEVVVRYVGKQCYMAASTVRVLAYFARSPGGRAMIPFFITLFQMRLSGRRTEPVVSKVSRCLAKYDENQVVDILEYLLAIARFRVVIRWSFVDQLSQQWLHKLRQTTTHVCKECHPEHSTRKFKVMGILTTSACIPDLGRNLHKVE
jgi:hypothetical protein